MHPCFVLLREVSDLVRAEEAALADEDLEKAEEMATRRSVVLGDVWAMRQGCDAMALRKALSAVLTANRSLTVKAEALQQKLRRQKQDGRKQTRYFSAERHFHSVLRKSVYCDAKT